MKAFIQLYKCAFITEILFLNINRVPRAKWPNGLGSSPSNVSFIIFNAVCTHCVLTTVCLYRCSTTFIASAHCSVLHAGLGTGGTRWRGRLNRRCQGAEEPSYKGQPQSSPGTKHGPAVTVAYVIREAKQVTWVAREFEVDASHARAKRNDAEGTSHKEK